VQLPSCAGHCGRVRRCNRSMRGAPCCNRSREVPGAAQKRGPAAEMMIVLLLFLQKQNLTSKEGGERSGPAKAKSCGKRR
jgi:hypothetical protein